MLVYEKNARTLNVVFVLFLLLSATAHAANGNSRWIPLSSETSPNSVNVVTAGEKATGISITVEFPGIADDGVTDDSGRLYSQLRIPGCGAVASAVGSPELPFKGFFVEVPAGASVTYEYSGKPKNLGTEWRVYPMQPPMADNSYEEPVFTIDRKVYEKDVFLPEDTVIISEPSVIRGRHVVFVQVFPVQYNPATTELRATSSVSLTLSFDRAGTRDDQLRKTELATVDSEKLADRLIVNYKPVDLTKKRYDKTRSGQGADYLVIAADSLVNTVQPLAEWKRKKGFIASVVPMSEVGSTAADVKNYIQTAYDTWTPSPSFVLLVGDSGDVPPSNFSGYASCVSDYPYSCVDGTDIYADLTIGRLPVSTVTDCKNVISKILVYDRNPDMGDWYDDFLAAAYFQDSGNNGYADRWFMETAMTNYMFFTGQLGWDGHTALCTTFSPSSHSTWRFRGDSYPHRGLINQNHWGVNPYPNPVPRWVVDLWTSHSQATSNISTAINAGVGIVQHRDHGSETGWGDPPYYKSDINSLNNGTKTPVVFSTNCLTGSFYLSGRDCFCEAFLKKYPGGCVGIVGATRISYSGFNDLLVHGTYTAMWPEYDPTYAQTRYPNTWRPAEALNFGKYYLSSYYGTGSVVPSEFHMFHWFGDPEMSLRTDTPAALSVTHPQWGIVDQSQDVVIDVKQNGSPVEGALVCISHNTSGQHWTGMTNTWGTVTLTDLTFTESDDYDVVVTARNAIPYEGIIDASISSRGRVVLNRNQYSCDTEISVQLGDLDLMGSGLQDVTFVSSGGDQETVSLAEVVSGSGFFSGTLATSDGIVLPNDGELQLEHDDQITVNYYDLDTGTGNPGIADDQAFADCAAPVISDVSSETVGLRASVSLDTDTTACASIAYGTSCGDLENLSVGNCVAGRHDFVLAPLIGRTRYYFVVYAEDEQGNAVMDDNDGQCYSFITPEIDFYDDFPKRYLDSTTWQVTTGNPSIVEDDAVNQPSEPYSLLLESGDMVESVPIDLSGRCGTVLRFKHRALNDTVNWQSGAGLAYRSVNGGFWLEIPQCSIWKAPRDNYGEMAVVLPADACHTDFQFRLQNTISYGNAGWFIDDVIIETGEGVDCNENGISDACDISSGVSSDCQFDLIPDECQLEGRDCNDNNVPDECEMQDCNENGVLDDCDIAGGTSSDCNTNGVPDGCEFELEWSTTRIEAPNMEQRSYFGGEVSLDGKTALVSAQLEDSTGENAGAVYVLNYGKNDWQQVDRLTPSGVTSRGQFGRSCFLKGNLAIIGAPYDSQEAEYSGAAYIFRKDAAGWQEEAKLVAGDPGYHEYFGQVAIDDDVAIVGAYFADSQSGAAYVFRYNGSAWVQEAKLASGSSGYNPRFGNNVALEGDIAVVGAYRDDVQGTDSGAVYVFRFNGSSWVREARLTGSGITTESYFGDRVSINGDMIAVGSYGENNETGAAYVFRYNGATWVEDARLVPGDAVVGDRIGSDTACYGNQVVVSSYTSDKVYLYEYTGTEWQLSNTFVDPVDDISGNNDFGFSVDLDSGALVVGARLDSELASEVGAAYIFDYVKKDCNTNGVLDECDIASGVAGDCNENGVIDECDIADGVARDCNENLIPDFCEGAQLGDYDGDCEVNLSDFAVFTECNTQGPGAGPDPVLPVTGEECLSFFDFDGDGDVDLLDFARFQVVFNEGI